MTINKIESFKPVFGENAKRMIEGISNVTASRNIPLGSVQISQFTDNPSS